MPYAFVVTRTGCEALLKREVSRTRPEFRPAFSRKGLVTFRVPEEETLETLSRWPVVFGRVRGLTLRRIDDLAGLPAAVAEAVAPWRGKGPVRLHVFDRDGDDPRDDRRPFQDLARTLRDRLRESAPPGTFHGDATARVEDLVLDVLVMGPREVLLGLHRHHGDQSPHPGACPPLDPPAAVPSRAWWKLEEALLRTGLHPRAGEKAVDLGCSPGGASLALMHRGLEVWGVDPTPVDPSLVLGNGPGRFTQIQRPVQAVHPGDLPREFQWMVVDINEGPDRVLPEVRRLAQGRHLRGLLVTVKANRLEVADRIPIIEAFLRDLGFRQVRLFQGYHHHREFMAAAWGQRG